MSPTRRPSGNELARALKSSGLPPPSLALMMALLVHHYDWKSRTVTKDGGPPSLTDLQTETGYCRTTVRDHLHALELAGWITRTPPPVELARRDHARTEYELHLPGSEHQAAVRAEQPSGQDAKARRERLAAYVAERRAANQAAIPTRKVGRGRPARGAAYDWTRRRELVELAAATLAELTGRQLGRADAKAAVSLVLGGRDPAKVKDPAAYLVRSLRREPRRFLPAEPPPPPVAAAPPAARPSDARVREILAGSGLRPAAT